MNRWKKSAIYSLISDVAAGWGWPLRLGDYLLELEQEPCSLPSLPKTASGQYRECWDFWKLPEPIKLSSNLVRKQVIKEWTCDIRDIEALGAAKDFPEECADLDEFAVRFCSPWCNETAEEAVERNMEYREVRIDHPGTFDHFTIYDWDGRLILSNAGGAHHFATARYIAGKIGVRRRLCGNLNRYSLDPVVVDQLTNDFGIFVVEDAIYRGLWKLLQQLGNKNYYAPLPRPYEALSALFLPKSNVRSQRVSTLLSERGFFDLGKYLKTLCNRGKGRSLQT